jgi:hypothetical protein
MLAQSKASRSKHEIWMERVKQELAVCEKHELEFLAAEREERQRKLGLTKAGIWL